MSYNKEMTTHQSENTVIECTDLGKCYRVYDNPKARLKQALWRGRKQYYKEFWALRNINFMVQRGESLGIIGRNGSGKSTLLQMICGTLTPTEGNLRTNGRIAALLELGSGFNPEFTGIENVYLNASMLGLSKEEINNRIDDILGFADIGDFINQPVKSYSSGMSVRLAFAVVAHVNADILIIDEALAVGDAFFTQKCMRFINRFRTESSLLFVSHDASAVSALCDKALLLRQGRQVMLGKPKRLIAEYTKEMYGSTQEVNSASIENTTTNVTPICESTAEEQNEWIDYRASTINSSSIANILAITQFEECLLSAESFGNGKAQIKKVRLLESKTRKPILVGRGGERVILRVEAFAINHIKNPIIGFLLKNEKGQVLIGDNSLNSISNLLGQSNCAEIPEQTYFSAEFEFTIPLLPKGSYGFTVCLGQGTQVEHEQLQWLNDALIFESLNTSIAAGLAGVPMHRITVQINTTTT